MKISSIQALSFLIALGTLTFTSCKKEPEVVDVVPSSTVDYDAVLTDLLVEHGEGQGAAFFTMPDETNYSQIPQDPNNPITSAKVLLGKLLFHESIIGTESKLEQGAQTYSCASCHHAAAGFQANMQQGIGEGGLGFGIAGESRMMNPEYPMDSLDIQPLRTPSAMNGAYQDVMLWNGAFGGTGTNKGTEGSWGMGTPMFNNLFELQGLETQAIAGLTVHRMSIDQSFVDDYPEYKELFDQAFSSWPQATRYGARTAGMAIAAYERTLLSNQAPWQEYLKGDAQALTTNQKKGAVLFFDKAQCVQCHTGPALNSMTFHGLGMKDMYGGDIYIPEDSFNSVRGRGGFTNNTEDLCKYKTPQLYNLTDSPFLGHGGTYHSVKEIIEYKNEAVSDNPIVPESQLSEYFIPLNLNEEEINQLVDFIENALYDPNLFRYVPDEVISGSCIPNSDEMSMTQMGCIF